MEPQVHGAFVDTRDREDLWVAIDRANLNPPRTVKASPHGFIHWDVDTSLRPLPVGVQGVLSLMTQDGDVGGFQCVPELFYKREEWVKDAAGGPRPMHPDTTGLQIVSIDLEAADLLVFNSHRSFCLALSQPRLAFSRSPAGSCLATARASAPVRHGRGPDHARGDDCGNGT